MEFIICDYFFLKGNIRYAINESFISKYMCLSNKNAINFIEQIRHKRAEPTYHTKALVHYGHLDT